MSLDAITLRRVLSLALAVWTNRPVSYGECGYTGTNNVGTVLKDAVRFDKFICGANDDKS